MPRQKRSPPAASTPAPEDVLFCELTLYVAGTSARSLRAITNIKRLCENQFGGRYKLKIVDIYQQPAEASAAQVIALPTLVRAKPEPKRVFVGDMIAEADLSGTFRQAASCG